MYSIKEIFYTLQGEGAHTGRPAVFCRFSGCNFWNGDESQRHKAVCTFCDTDFVGTDGQGGGVYTDAFSLGAAVAAHWPKDKGNRFVVLTGGEPLLQVDSTLIDVLHDLKFYIAVETNGSILPPLGLDWVCVSPKTRVIRANTGDELKLVYPQTNVLPAHFSGLTFQHKWIQPLDDAKQAQNTELCIQFCKENPEWKLSVQVHKILNIP